MRMNESCKFWKCVIQKDRLFQIKEEMFHPLRKKKQKMAQMTHERVRMFVFVSKTVQIVVTLCVF